MFLRDLFHARRKVGKKWQHDPSQQPWFDQPDAHRQLEERRIHDGLTDEEFEGLRCWIDHGYIVLRDIVPDEHVDGMLQDLDEVWQTRTAIPNLVVEQIQLKPEDPPGLPHSRLITLDNAIRENLKRDCRWRIHGFWSHSPSTEKIFRNPHLARMASIVLGKPAEPQYTINFMYGSTQELHQDTAVFAVAPRNYLVGAWLACEDIDADSGPLVYYPGSHRAEFFPKFDNYPQTNLKTCPKPQMAEYREWLIEVARRYEPHTFVARKGEVFLWHGMLIHGGAPINNTALTRRSYVCHYIPPGFNREHEVEGPFNW